MPTLAVPPAISGAESAGSMPWGIGALSLSIRQRLPVANGQGNSYRPFTPEDANFAQGDYELEAGPLPPSGEATSPSAPVATFRTLSDVEMGHGAEPAAQPQQWPEAPHLSRVSSPRATVQKGTGDGYGGWSLPAIASSPAQVSSSAPVLARAPVDRPANGGQAADSASGGGQPVESANAPSLDEMAHEVYAILKRRLALERERSWGMG